MKVIILQLSSKENVWVNSNNILYFQREHVVNNIGQYDVFTRIQLTNGSIRVIDGCELIKTKLENVE